MATLTKEQTTYLVAALDSMYSDVYLKIDGYFVLASLRRYKNRLFQVIYVNGFIKSEWLEHVNSVDEIKDIPRRFYRRRVRSLFKAAEIKESEKMFGKRWCKKHEIYRKKVFAVPDFNSAMTFVRHIKKYNDSIEIIDKETYDAGVKPLIDAEKELGNGMMI